MPDGCQLREDCELVAKRNPPFASLVCLQTASSAAPGALRKEFVAAFPRLANAAARELVAALDTFQHQLEHGPPVQHYEEWFSFVSPLLPLLPFVEPTSELGLFLSRYCILLAALCRFHAWKALKDAAKSTEYGIPRHLQKEAVLRLQKVFDAPSAAAEKSEWQDYVVWFNRIDGIKAAKSPAACGDAEHYGKAWIQYILKQWMSHRWHCAMAMRIRNTVSHYLINTTNHAELFFNKLKNNWLRGLRIANLSLAIKLLVGLPSDIQAQKTCMVARACDHVERVLNGTSPLVSNVHAEALRAKVKDLLTMYSEGSGRVEVVNPGLGIIRLAPASASWEFTDSEEPDRMPVVASPDAGQPLTPDTKLIGCGRENVAAHKAMVASAVAAGSARPGPAVSRPEDIAQFCEWIFTIKSHPLFGTTFPDVIASSNSKDVASQVADTLRYFHCAFVTGIVELAASQRTPLAPTHARPSEQVDELLASNQQLRRLMLSCHPVPLRSDFRSRVDLETSDGSFKLPDAALIYCVMTTMTAAHWRTYARRMFFTGRARSLLTGEPLDLGFFITMYDALALADTLCQNGKAGADITAFYIGQELRAANNSAKFDRPLEHWTKRGNANIAELIFCSSMDPSRGRVFNALGPGTVTVERRVLAFLPRSAAVDIAEMLALMAILPLGPVLLNNSPTGTAERFLHPKYPGASCTADRNCQELANQVVRSGYLSTVCIDALPLTLDFFTHRLLATLEMLVVAQRLRDASGSAVMPSSSTAGRCSVSQLLLAQRTPLHHASAAVLAASSSSSSRAHYVVHVYANYCSCPSFRATFLCKHLAFARLLTAASVRSESRQRALGELNYFDSEHLLFASASDRYAPLVGNGFFKHAPGSHSLTLQPLQRQPGSATSAVTCAEVLEAADSLVSVLRDLQSASVDQQQMLGSSHLDRILTHVAKARELANAAMRSLSAASTESHRGLSRRLEPAARSRSEIEARSSAYQQLTLNSASILLARASTHFSAETQSSFTPPGAAASPAVGSTLAHDAELLLSAYSSVLGPCTSSSTSLPTRSDALLPALASAPSASLVDRSATAVSRLMVPAAEVTQPLRLDKSTCVSQPSGHAAASTSNAALSARALAQHSPATLSSAASAAVGHISCSTSSVEASSHGGTAAKRARLHSFAADDDDN